MKKVLLLLALIGPAAACVAARAQVPPEDHPALVVPPVPPRVIEPMPAEAPPLDPVGELPAAPSNPPRKPPVRDPSRPVATDPKPDAKPPDAPPPDPATSNPPAPATPPVPPLRTPGTADGPGAAKQIRDTIDRAVKILGGVDYQALKPDSRHNYDNAKSFIKQSEAALKANDVVSAKSLADRAENIAKLLAGG